MSYKIVTKRCFGIRVYAIMGANGALLDQSTGSHWWFPHERASSHCWCMFKKDVEYRYQSITGQLKFEEVE